MNFDWFHATQVEESDNYALFFECKRRHFSMKNTTATRPRHKHSTGSTVLPLGLAEPKEQPRLLQLSRFYLLPFPRKKLGYLRTWTPHVLILMITDCGISECTPPQKVKAIYAGKGGKIQVNRSNWKKRMLQNDRPYYVGEKWILCMKLLFISLVQGWEHDTNIPYTHDRSDSVVWFFHVKLAIVLWLMKP